MNIPEKMIVSNIKAKQYINAIRQNSKDPQVIYNSLRGYIQNKFLLEDEDFATDELLLLSVKSISRILEVQPEELKKMDAEGCQKTNSVIDKKVMLLISIEKALGIHFDEEKTAEISTIKELSMEVYKLIKDQRISEYGEM